MFSKKVQRIIVIVLAVIMALGLIAGCILPALS